MRVHHFLSSRALSILLAVTVLGTSSAAAQENPDGPAPVTLAAAIAQRPLQIELRPVAPDRRIASEERPGALLPMYGSLIALQGLDIHSTRRAMGSGTTREANPLMGSVVHNGAAFVAVKAGVTAGAIWASEKLWKKHPKRALVFTALLNVTLAAVVTHNYRVAK